MRNPFFSVVIPTLNEEKYLSKLLNNLSMQSFQEFEVIVVDGNSKDKTEQVAKSFNEKLPTLSYIQSGKSNVAYQRNLGATFAKGSYLIFFDADVGIGQTFIEEIHVKVIKKPFLFATTWMVADSQNSIDQLMVKLGNFAYEIANNINKPFLGGFNVIVKKNIFNKLKGFREDMTINEDGDFALRAYKNNIELTILPEPKLVISLRRFRSEGTLEVLRKYTQAQVYTLVKGPITTQLFDYPMGGHVYAGKVNKKMKLAAYLKTMENFGRKLNKLMLE